MRYFWFLSLELQIHICTGTCEVSEESPERHNVRSHKTLEKGGLWASAGGVYGVRL